MELKSSKWYHLNFKDNSNIQIKLSKVQIKGSKTLNGTIKLGHVSGQLINQLGANAIIQVKLN